MLVAVSRLTVFLMSLRLPIALMIMLGATPLAAADTPFASRQVANDLDVVTVAPGVWSFVSGDTAHALVNGNSTLIDTAEGAVVVDAPGMELAERHIAQIKKLTKSPVRFLVITHWHPDHMIGAAAYKKAYPGVTIISTDYTAMIAERRVTGTIDTFFKKGGIDGLIETTQRQVDTGVGEDGGALSEYEIERAKRDVADFKRAKKASGRVQYFGPDETFTSEMALTLGGRDIKIKAVRGHTSGDAYIYLPAERVLIAGDLVINPTPYGINSLFDQWIEQLDTFLAMPLAAIVPGHGEVLASKDYIRLQRDAISSLMEQAADAARKRLTLEQWKETANLDAFEERFTEGDPDRKWAWKNYFFDPALERAYIIARGEM
jgi:glyoxylase-like metal-dependent hydrolase (beta-lactamase superfamily II)